MVSTCVDVPDRLERRAGNRKVVPMMNTYPKSRLTPDRRKVQFQAALLAVCFGSMTMAAAAATPVLSFDFNEVDTSSVKDSVNNLVGTPAGDPPTSVTDTPSGQAGDRAIHFESGQYLT